MKVTDKQTHTEVELETNAGQCNFRSVMKAETKGDLRGFSRDAETLELGNMIQNNSKGCPIVVKINDTYTKVR